MSCKDFLLIFEISYKYVISQEWVTVNAFHVSCRFTTPRSATVKFDIKLYKSDVNSYLVDFQNITKPQLEPHGQVGDEGDCTGVYAFFEATTRLVTKLALA